MASSRSAGGLFGVGCGAQINPPVLWAEPNLVNESSHVPNASRHAAAHHTANARRADKLPFHPLQQRHPSRGESVAFGSPPSPPPGALPQRPSVAAAGTAHSVRLLTPASSSKEKNVDQKMSVKLPWIRFDSEKKGRLSEGSKWCTVCLEEFEHGDCQSWLPCIHTFHKQCIEKWLRRSKSCPVCQIDISTLVRKTDSRLPKNHTEASRPALALTCSPAHRSTGGRQLPATASTAAGGAGLGASAAVAAGREGAA